MCTRTHTRAHTAFKAKGLISDAPVGEDGARGVGGACWGGRGLERGREGKPGGKCFRKESNHRL